MKQLLVLTILLITSDAVGQFENARERGPVATVRSILAVSPGSTDTLSFPQVTIADKRLEALVNHHLQYRILGGIASLTQSRAFLTSQEYKDGQPGLDALEYRVLRNTNRLLVIHVDGEGVGAHPSPLQIDCSIDLVRGTPIDGRELFTEEGATHITERVQAVRADSIQAQMRMIDANASTMEIDSGLAASIREDFEGCNERVDFHDLLALDDTVFFTSFGCLPHVVQALEIDWTVGIPGKELLPYLSPYGRALLLGGNYTPPERSLYDTRLYHGTIGTHPVTVMLSNNYESYVSGSYFYDAKGLPIALSGEWDHGSLRLLEETEDKPYPTLVLKQSNGHLGGTWTRGKSKPLPVELSPY